jgi:hypothetical protein
MIDIYALLAIPLAAGINVLTSKGKIATSLFSAVLGFFIYLNFFQSKQAAECQIHYDAMTPKAYWAIFLQDKWPPEQYLEYTDAEKAMIGEERY